MDHPKIGVSHWAAPDLQSFGFEGDGEELAQNAKVEVIDLGVNDIILQLKFVEGEENSTLLVKGVANGTREGSPGGLYPGSNRDIWTSFKVVPVKSLNGAIGGECYYEPGEGEE